MFFCEIVKKFLEQLVLKNTSGGCFFISAYIWRGSIFSNIGFAQENRES